MSRGVLAFSFALVSVSGCGSAFGVEHYREGLPATDLCMRMVADDTHEAEATLPRLGTEEPIGLAAGIVVTAEQVEHVRLLDAAEGNRVIVIVLRDPGRDRLREATTDATGRRVAIVAGGHVIAAPTLRGPLTESEAYVAVPVDQLEAAFASMTSR
jgi:preprotein translocase subunit SecD